MDERLRFVARLLEGEKMAPLCAAFGISRKTGYKIFDPPGHLPQNGRHARMHLTLKKEATKPAAANVLQQQARFDAFVERYNAERPHKRSG